MVDLPQGSNEKKVDQLWLILPPQNFHMDYQVPHQYESPSASAQWLQFQEVWVYPFNELKYLLGVFHWSLVFQGTFCCNSWSYSSTWSLMWSSRLTHRWGNRIHCTYFPKLKLKLPTLNSSWTGQSHLKYQFNRQTLDTSQTKCVEEMQSKVYRLLGETPPNGPEFAKSVKRILGREEAWNRY